MRTKHPSVSCRNSYLLFIPYETMLAEYKVNSKQWNLGWKPWPMQYVMTQRKSKWLTCSLMSCIGMRFWYENSSVIKNIPKVKYSAVCHLMHISDITWFLDNGDSWLSPCFALLFCLVLPCLAVTFCRYHRAAWWNLC